jgi:hypothetical protein
MPWRDVPAVERALDAALNAFDWLRADSIVDELAARIREESNPFPPVYTSRILRRLRRKRRFKQIQQMADALGSSGQDSPLVRRHYAQALIDANQFGHAREILESILEDPSERLEALGLMGRVEKQLYVEAARHGARVNADHLRKALDSYLAGYREAPQQNRWHGINAAALIARASRDGVQIPGVPPAQEIAHDILAALQILEEKRDAELPAWDVATAMEACVALGDADAVEHRALEYAGCCDADAFEVFSTLRQMREVWQLSEDDPLGARLLPVLDAALLRRQGGDVTITARDAQKHLEKIFGPDRFNTLAWYQEGLARCRGIARIETLGGHGYGTGWLADSGAFFPGYPGRLLLLTNAHVVSSESFANALRPDDALAHFQMLGARLRVRSIFWCSQEYDASFLELDGTPQAEPLPLHTSTVRMTKPPSRVYIIGHPGGRDLAFSLQDSQMVACSERVLHYRTPTEAGSSGSPVFEALGWRVVALHRAGSEKMQSLSAPGETYEANEGIAIGSLRQATIADHSAGA